MLRQRARKVGHGREQHTFTKRARTGFRAMGASGFRECFFDPVNEGLRPAKGHEKTSGRGSTMEETERRGWDDSG